MNDLTEKLKELLIHCAPKAYSSAGNFIDALAQQLAPEIEKLIPRWIPVGERLPEPNTDILIAHDLEDAGDDLCVDTGLMTKEGKWLHAHHNWFADDEWPEIDGKILFWMPVPKGPMG